MFQCEGVVLVTYVLKVYHWWSNCSWLAFQKQFAGKAYLKIDLLVKTPLHRRSMEVRRSGLWAPDLNKINPYRNKQTNKNKRAWNNRKQPEKQKKSKLRKEKKWYKKKNMHTRRTKKGYIAETPWTPPRPLLSPCFSNGLSLRPLRMHARILVTLVSLSQLCVIHTYMWHT